MTSVSDTYFSIAAESRASIREKASRFLAFAFPVDNEEKIRRDLETLRRVYFNASHHCYAYRIGHPDTAVFRFNDDGEPSGSAGKPIYGQILSHQVSDVLVAVIRYFGGAKLGLSGLIQAYKSAASLALDQCLMTPKVLMYDFSISFPVRAINEVMRILKKEGADIVKQDFDETYTVRFFLRRSKGDEVERRLTNITNISICKQLG